MIDRITVSELQQYLTKQIEMGNGNEHITVEQYYILNPLNIDTLSFNGVPVSDFTICDAYYADALESTINYCEFIEHALEHGEITSYEATIFADELSVSKNNIVDTATLEYIDKLIDELKYI